MNIFYIIFLLLDIYLIILYKRNVYETRFGDYIKIKLPIYIYLIVIFFSLIPILNVIIFLIIIILTIIALMEKDIVIKHKFLEKIYKFLIKKI